MKHYKFLALAIFAVALFGIFVVQRTGKLAFECPKPTGSRIPPIQSKLVVNGLIHPNYVTHANDGSGHLFVVERAGRIRMVKEERLLPTPFLDISEHVFSPDSDPSHATAEQGFLSIAFHPSYSANRRFFVNYTAIPDGRTIVAEYVVPPGSTVADPQNRRVILESPNLGKTIMVASSNSERMGICTLGWEMEGMSLAMSKRLKIWDHCWVKSCALMWIRRLLMLSLQTILF